MGEDLSSLPPGVPLRFLAELDDVEHESFKSQKTAALGKEGIQPGIKMRADLGPVRLFFSRLFGHTVNVEVGNKTYAFGRNSLEHFLRRHAEEAGLKSEIGIEGKQGTLNYNDLARGLRTLLDNKEVLREMVDTRKELEKNPQQNQPTLQLYRDLAAPFVRGQREKRIEVLGSYGSDFTLNPAKLRSLMSEAIRYGVSPSLDSLPAPKAALQQQRMKKIPATTIPSGVERGTLKGSIPSTVFIQVLAAASIVPSADPDVARQAQTIHDLASAKPAAIKADATELDDPPIPGVTSVVIPSAQEILQGQQQRASAAKPVSEARTADFAHRSADFIAYERAHLDYIQEMIVQLKLEGGLNKELEQRILEEIQKFASALNDDKLQIHDDYQRDLQELLSELEGLTSSVVIPSAQEALQGQQQGASAAKPVSEARTADFVHRSADFIAYERAHLDYIQEMIAQLKLERGLNKELAQRIPKEIQKFAFALNDDKLQIHDDYRRDLQALLSELEGLTSAELMDIILPDKVIKKVRAAPPAKPSPQYTLANIHQAARYGKEEREKFMQALLSGEVGGRFEYYSALKVCEKLSIEDLLTLSEAAPLNHEKSVDFRQFVAHQIEMRLQPPSFQKKTAEFPSFQAREMVQRPMIDTAIAEGQRQTSLIRKWQSFVSPAEQQKLETLIQEYYAAENVLRVGDFATTDALQTAIRFFSLIYTDTVRELENISRDYLWLATRPGASDKAVACAKELLLHVYATADVNKVFVDLQGISDPNAFDVADIDEAERFKILTLRDTVLQEIIQKTKTNAALAAPVVVDVDKKKPALQQRASKAKSSKAAQKYEMRMKAWAQKHGIIRNENETESDYMVRVVTAFDKSAQVPEFLSDVQTRLLSKHNVPPVVPPVVSDVERQAQISNKLKAAEAIAEGQKQTALIRKLQAFVPAVEQQKLEILIQKYQVAENALRAGDFATTDALQAAIHSLKLMYAEALNELRVPSHDYLWQATRPEVSDEAVACAKALLGVYASPDSIEQAFRDLQDISNRSEFDEFFDVDNEGVKIADLPSDILQEIIQKVKINGEPIAPEAPEALRGSDSGRRPPKLNFDGYIRDLQDDMEIYGRSIGGNSPRSKRPYKVSRDDLEAHFSKLAQANKEQDFEVLKTTQKQFMNNLIAYQNKLEKEESLLPREDLGHVVEARIQDRRSRIEEQSLQGRSRLPATPARQERLTVLKGFEELSSSERDKAFKLLQLPLPENFADLTRMNESYKDTQALESAKKAKEAVQARRQAPSVVASPETTSAIRTSGQVREITYSSDDVQQVINSGLRKAEDRLKTFKGDKTKQLYLDQKDHALVEQYLERELQNIRDTINTQYNQFPLFQSQLDILKNSIQERVKIFNDLCNRFSKEDSRKRAELVNFVKEEMASPEEWETS